MPFKPGEGRPAFNITESEIRYAMEHTSSCAGAARFLKISYEAFRKYAKLYKDESSGKTLFELHKNQSGKGIAKASSVRMNGKYGLNEILAGKHPNYNPTYLKRRLIKSGCMEEKCSSCGFEERRITDYSVPLMLDWIDGDKTNHKKENLRLVCYNCYYLEVGNPFGGKMRIDP